MGNYTIDSEMKLDLMYNKVKLFLRCVIWYPKVPKSTQKYQQVPKSTSKFQKVSNSTKKYQQVQKSTKMYQKVPKK